MVSQTLAAYEQVLQENRAEIRGAVMGAVMDDDEAALAATQGEV